jgi:hypothetical protein
VNLFIYYIIYWPYRRNFKSKTSKAVLDISFDSQHNNQADHEMSLIKKHKEDINTPTHAQATAALGAALGAA